MNDNTELMTAGNPAIADDFMIQVAAQAEARVDAVMKIKRLAIKVTNGNDWCDQNGKPYMMVSAAEKIANLFNISWRVDEPRCDEEADGNFTYTYRGTFTLAGRSIDVEGSRSSKDGFFRQYEYTDGKKSEKDVSQRDNKRDVRMAAYTNLLGNGISRILGMRNMTYADLEEFAGITQAMIGKVEYKSKAKPDRSPIKQPESVKDASGDSGKAEANTFTAEIILDAPQTQDGKSAKGEWHRTYAKGSDGSYYQTFDAKIAEEMFRLSGYDVSILYKFSKTEKGESRQVLSIQEKGL